MLDAAPLAMFAAEFEPAEPLGRRRSRRASVSFDARLGRGGFNRALCKVVDLSCNGCRIQTYSQLHRDALIWLTLPKFGPRVARIVWIGAFEAGCDFEEPLDEACFEALVAA